jgi:thiol-disulfide isomerase/thioredoxin
MVRINGLGLGIGAVLVIVTEALAEQPYAAALVRQVRDREAWIERVASLQLKAENHWERPPRGIEQRRRELQKQFPGADLSSLRDWQPRGTTIVELGFDRARVRLRVQQVGFEDDLRIWDGKRFILHNSYDRSPDRNGYLINREPDKWLYPHVWTDFQSFRAGPHVFWWHGPKERAEIVGSRMAGKPEDFAYEGRADFHGTSCHVVSHWDSWTSLFIGVEDGRLRGMRSGASLTAKFNRSLIELLRRAGRQIRDNQDAEALWPSLSKAERDVIRREGAARLTQLIDPCDESWLEHEKEVAPGWWMPMTQGASLFGVDEKGQPFEALRHQLKIIDVKLNEPVPDALFAVEFKEGERINDQTADPPLSYRYKAKMPPEEWSTIVTRAKERAVHDRTQEKKQAALIDRAAAEFPTDATWLNSKPLTLKDLAGKVVILDFWAEWCGPCRNDLPVLSAVHKKRQKDLVVIGVHTPGSELKAIRKVMKEFELEYPICVDVPAPKSATTWGTLYEAYRVDRIPHSVVIDRQRKIAAVGALGDVLPRASELASRPL